jgi:hypothetical protein
MCIGIYDTCVLVEVVACRAMGPADLLLACSLKGVHACMRISMIYVCM